VTAEDFATFEIQRPSAVRRPPSSSLLSTFRPIF
jgi:hypothetical protein